MSDAPYLTDIYHSLMENRQLKIGVMAPSQTYKSSIHKFLQLYLLRYAETTSLCIYQNEKYCEDTNKSLTNLMQAIPELKQELDKPFSRKNDCFSFSNGVAYFQGAGSPVATRAIEYVICDEINLWGSNQGGNSNILQSQARITQYENGKWLAVCTPTTESTDPDHIDPFSIYGIWYLGSRGTYYLRCQKCKKLTCNTQKVSNLQFELDKNNQVVKKSLRLICPQCKKEHTEKDRYKIIEQGGYIHTNKSMMNIQRTFAWGALASKAPSHNWYDIAVKQINAGRSASKDEQQDFDNNSRGLPLLIRYDREKNDDLRIRIVKTEPAKEDVKHIIVTADSQDYGWKYTVTAVTTKMNMHVLKYGIADEISDLVQVYNSKYYDRHIDLMLIDQRGHRGKEVVKLCNQLNLCWLYQGFGTGTGKGSITKKFMLSKSSAKTIKCQARTYQADLLYYLYQQYKQDQFYITFHADTDESFLDEVSAMKPNKGKRSGHEYENWEATTPHDYFDCLKMMLCAIQLLKLLEAVKQKTAKRKPTVPFKKPF